MNRSRGHPEDDGIVASAARNASGLFAITSTFMVRGEPTAHDDCERSEAISRWMRAAPLRRAPSRGERRSLSLVSGHNRALRALLTRQAWTA